MSIYFTADTHFFHNNIRRYAQRDFETVEAMNEALIARWNERVGQTDTVYHLGDVAFARAEKAERLLNRLNGKIVLIRGNHDSKDVLALPRWESVNDLLEVSINGQLTTLCHYKMAVFNKAHRGAIQLFGHSHTGKNGVPLPQGAGSMDNSQQCDVGVDCWDYRPVTLSEILDRMATLPPYRSGDHHVAVA